jgi:hypothetical protein
MSVKIARLRSGEDVIATIKEVVNSETKQVAAIQLEDPYNVSIVEDTASLFNTDSGQPKKTSSPQISFYPWAPLSVNRTLYIDANELICVYDPHNEVIEQYTKLLEAINGGTDDGRNGRDGGDGIGGDGNVSTDSEVNFAETPGEESDWEGN